MQVMVKRHEKGSNEKEKGSRVTCKAFDYFQIRNAMWEHVSTEFDWSILDLVVSKLRI